MDGSPTRYVPTIGFGHTAKRSKWPDVFTLSSDRRCFVISSSVVPRLADRSPASSKALMHDDAAKKHRPGTALGGAAKETPSFCPTAFLYEHPRYDSRSSEPGRQIGSRLTRDSLTVLSLANRRCLWPDFEIGPSLAGRSHPNDSLRLPRSHIPVPALVSILLPGLVWILTSPLRLLVGDDQVGMSLVSPPSPSPRVSLRPLLITSTKLAPSYSWYH
jgi:hypothetical protein